MGWGGWVFLLITLSPQSSRLGCDNILIGITKLLPCLEDPIVSSNILFTMTEMLNAYPGCKDERYRNCSRILSMSQLGLKKWKTIL